MNAGDTVHNGSVGEGRTESILMDRDSDVGVAGGGKAAADVGWSW